MNSYEEKKSAEMQSPVHKKPQAQFAPVISGAVLFVLGILASPWFISHAAPASSKTSLSLSEKLFLFLVSAVLICAGIVLIAARRKISGKQLLFISIPIVFAILIAEFGMRVYFTVKNAIARRYDFSSQVGWVTPAHDHWSREVPGFGRVNFSTKNDGFREFGDLHTTGTRIFVIGDSFTHGYTVSDGKAYYDEVARRASNVQLFVYGCGGYGTLQELMILKKYFDVIRPDLVLWQFCTNDIINNNYELEARSYLNNKHMLRPYLRNGEIEYLFPNQDYGPLYNIVEHSYLLKFFDVRLNILKTDITGTIESTLSTTSPLVQQSARITRTLMQRVKARCGSTPIAAFSVDKQFYAGSDFVGSTYQDICREAGIHWIQGVPDAIDTAKAEGKKVTGAPYDPFHWNEAGHKIAGDIIFEDLSRAGLLH